MKKSILSLRVLLFTIFTIAGCSAPTPSPTPLPSAPPTTPPTQTPNPSLTPIKPTALPATPTSEFRVKPRATNEADSENLYKECGPNFTRYEGGTYEGWPQGPDGKGLPTGVDLNPEWDDARFDYRTFTGCLLTEAVPDTSVFSENTIGLTVGFYDVHGKLHAYPAILGGVKADGSLLRTGVGVLQQDGSMLYKSVFAPDALDLINTRFSDPNVARIVDIDVIVHDKTNGTAWSATSLINGQKNTFDQLYEALKSGEGFPAASDSFVLVLWQIGLRK